MALEEMADGVENPLVHTELSLEKVSHSLTGQIVLCRPKPSGHDDDVRPLAGVFQGLVQVLPVVPNNGLVGNLNPHLLKLFRQEEGVGVPPVGCEKLTPYGDDLCSHSNPRQK